MGRSPCLAKAGHSQARAQQPGGSHGGPGLEEPYPTAWRALPSEADDRKPLSPPGHLPTPTQVHIGLVPGQGAPLEEKKASRNGAYPSDRLGTRGPRCRARLPTGRLLWRGVEWRERNRPQFTMAAQHLGDKILQREEPARNSLTPLTMTLHGVRG